MQLLENFIKLVLKGIFFSTRAFNFQVSGYVLLKVHALPEKKKKSPANVVSEIL